MSNSWKRTGIGVLGLLLVLLSLNWQPGTAAAATVSGDASVDFDSVNKIWTLQTNLVRQKVQLTSSGQFLLTSLYNKKTSTEYKDDSLVSGEFRVTVDGAEYTGDSGGYTYDSYTATVLPVPAASPGAPGAVELKVVFHNAKIQVTAIYTIYPSSSRNSSSIIKRVFQFKNVTSGNITLSNIYISDFQLMNSQVGNLQLNYFWGGAMGPGVNELHSEAMNATYAKHFDSTEEHPGVTRADKYQGSNAYHPIFILNNATAGEGLFSGVNYLGPWTADVGYQNGSTVNLKISFTHQETLAPNGVFETPNSFTGVYAGDLDEMANQLIDWQYVYKWDYTRDGYYLNSSMWNSNWTDNNARYKPDVYFQTEKNIVELARRYGIDIAHQDYGWWTNNLTGDWSGPDWKQIRDYAAKSGMLFKLWMPPYLYNHGSKVIADHPDWALSPYASEFYSSYISNSFNTANDNAEHWMAGLLTAKQKEYGTYFARLDAWTMSPDDSGYPFLKQYRNYLQMLKDAKNADPNMGIEGVNSGGDFIDWDKMELVDDQQTSDGGGPDDTFYLSYLYPYAKLMSILGGADDTISVSKLEALRSTLVFKRYLVSQGLMGRYSKVYHPVSTGTGDTHTFLEFLTGDSTKGVILVDKSTTGTVYPKGLNPTGSYTVTFRKNGGSATNTGAYWMANGISLATAQVDEFILLNLANAPQRGTDTTPPAAPASVSKQTAYNAGSTGTEISWTASTDNQWMGWYEIYRDGTLLDIVAKGTYYFDQSAGNSTNRGYAVKAVDADGNKSGSSSAVLNASDVNQASGGFSPSQGQNNWSYQYVNGTSYTDMTWDNAAGRWSLPGTNAIVGRGFFHPDVNDAVLVWTAPQSGTAFVNGNVFKQDTGGGDGVRVKIMKNGSQVWPASGWQSIAANDQIGLETDANVTVSAGDKLYFIVNRNSENSFDGTYWDPHVTLEPYNPAPVDSASDWFASTQGAGNWYYQYGTNGSYTDMTWDGVNNRWSQTGTNAIVGNTWQHPDTNDSVRTFQAPYAGTVWITGNVAKGDTGGGDGVLVKIMKNGSQVWPASGWQTIAYNDSIGYNVNVSTTVAANDKLYFIVNRNGENSFDRTIWNPTVSYRDPGTVQTVYRASDGFSPVQGNPWKYGSNDFKPRLAQDGFSSTQGANGWSYQYWNGTSYQNMTWDSANGRWNQPGTSSIVADMWQHPDTNDSVRALYMSRSGTVNITGVATHAPISGDGVNVKIMKNNAQIWPASGWQHLAPGDLTGVGMNFNTTVNAGDYLYFIVNKGFENSNDATNWNPAVLYLQSTNTDMSWDAVTGTWGRTGTNTLAGSNWQHPDAEQSIREFVAPRTGTIAITGRVAKNVKGGDGILVKILKNGTEQVWPYSGWWYIGSWDFKGTSLNKTLSVTAGDRIQFIVDKNGENSFDTTWWDPVITYQ